MSSGFFSSRGFDPTNGRNLFGNSLFSNGAPTLQQQEAYGLAGSTNTNSPAAMKQVWGGLTAAYGNANAPTGFRKWLTNDEQTNQNNWLADTAQRQSQGLAPQDYGSFSRSQDYGSQWDRLAPDEAGKSNYFFRSRYGG